MAYVNAGNCRSIASTATGLISDDIRIRQPQGGYFNSGDHNDQAVYVSSVAQVAAIFAVRANIGGSSSPYLGRFYSTGKTSQAEAAITATT